jgi:riboflavin kinase / FMN adenylyltransferase
LKPFTILKKNKIDTLAIGSFDGIHLGHQQLIKKLGPNGALFVIDKDQANITPGVKRIEYSKHPCMFYHFLKLKGLSGKEFVALLKKEFVNLKKIVVGYDFMFGLNRSCVAQDLHTLFDGEVEIIKEFIYKGVSVHSSVIRKLICEGKIAEANSFLGREFSISGEVVSGQGLGKKRLYPTINIKIKDYVLPKDGVYATRTRIGSKIYDSVSFVGKRVSTDDSFAVETHILDLDISLTPKSVEIFFVKHLRENIKFDTLERLKTQIGQDIQEAKHSLKVCNFYCLEFL